MVIGLYDIFNERWGAQTIWLYSDPHFGESVEESGLINKVSDEEQVRRINSKIGRKDTIIFLGDIGDLNWLKKVRGRKILITGNHDGGASNYQRHIEQETFDLKEHKADIYAKLVQDYPDCVIKIEKVYAFHSAYGFYSQWMATIDNCLCDEVYTGPLIIGPKLILSHEPIKIDGLFNIHGHVHLITPPNDSELNVCSMNINYTPVNLNRLMKQGLTSKVDSLHRITIDNARKRNEYPQM